MFMQMHEDDFKERGSRRRTNRKSEQVGPNVSSLTELKGV